MIGVYYIQDTDDQEQIALWREQMKDIGREVKDRLGLTCRMLRVRHMGDDHKGSPIQDNDIHWAILVQMSDDYTERLSQGLAILPYILKCEGVTGDSEYMAEWSKRA